MRVIILTVLLAAIFIECDFGVLLNDADLNHNLFVYTNKIRIIYDLYKAECPQEVRVKREDRVFMSTDLEVQKLQYQAILQKLLECRKKNQESRSTTTEKITTAENFKIKCQNAANLSDWWRQDYNSSNTRPGGPHSNEDGYACDLHEDLQWFRFTGDAGNKMLDKCPGIKSCGGIDGYWTDEEMPKVTGALYTVKVYGSHGVPNCKYHEEYMEVIRCSWNTDYDLIYRYTPKNGDYSITPSGNNSTSCPDVFCSMD